MRERDRDEPVGEGAPERGRRGAARKPPHPGDAEPEGRRDRRQHQAMKIVLVTRLAASDSSPASMRDVQTSIQ